MPRLPADSVIRGLTVTADKIRALATAGYDRTEISKALAIRYQHVRNVLLRSGMPGGLKREVAIPQPTITVEVPVGTVLKTTPSEYLLKAGFLVSGRWEVGSDGELDFTGEIPSHPGVYAFVLDGMVAYVGLSIRGLRGRMRQYRRGNPRQRTSARVNALIKGVLKDGRAVTILTVVPEDLEWHGLPVSTASGLETALIQKILPQWNIQIGKVRETS